MPQAQRRKHVSRQAGWKVCGSFNSPAAIRILSRSRHFTGSNANITKYLELTDHSSCELQKRAIAGIGPASLRTIVQSPISYVPNCGQLVVAASFFRTDRAQAGG